MDQKIELEKQFLNLLQQKISFKIVDEDQEKLLKAIERVLQQIDTANDEAKEIRTIWGKVRKLIQDLKNSVFVGKGLITNKTELQRMIARKYLIKELTSNIQVWEEIILRKTPELCEIFV